MSHPRYSVHGLAIVSADDRITDDAGTTPESLRNSADWKYFQDHLDAADVTVLGRLAHEHNPNDRARKRLILSRSLNGLAERPDGWWWNPEGTPWDDVCSSILPEGGSFAVPGGQKVFDLFLPLYDVFHLSRAERVVIGSGRLVFTNASPIRSADVILRNYGLQPGARTDLDPDASISLTLYRK